MANNPVDLDERRRLQEFQDDKMTSKLRQSELENLLLATPAKTLSEASTKALYLLELFSTTPEAQDPGRKELITHTILDLDRLRTRPQDKS